MTREKVLHPTRVRRHCSPHTSTASPLLWIMEHHSVCWCPQNLG
jgi:hypothetical protein